MREKGGAAYGEDGAHGPAALRPHLAAGIAGAGPVPGGAGRLSGAIERTGGREYSGEGKGCGGACCTGDTGGERVLPCRQGHGQHPAHSGLHRG